MKRDNGFMSGLIIGALFATVLFVLHGCATVDLSNEYASVELCAYWEQE